jgi:8-oxo-dGTP pyrophosphatase MutT (NUDIX family)
MKPPTLDALGRALTGNPKRSLIDPSLAPAGVLVLVYPKDGEHHVLLNRRSDSVEHHKGEIAFPGGGMDDGDESLRETALRETHEEMGIRPEDVLLLGELDDVPTSSSYVISPFVGTIPYPYPFRPSSVEVAEVLEAPLSHFMDRANHRIETRMKRGRLINGVAYGYRGSFVFGATAMVLTRLLQVVEEAMYEDVTWREKRA